MKIADHILKIFDNFMNAFFLMDLVNRNLPEITWLVQSDNYNQWYLICTEDDYQKHKEKLKDNYNL